VGKKPGNFQRRKASLKLRFLSPPGRKSQKLLSFFNLSTYQIIYK